MIIVMETPLSKDAGIQVEGNNLVNKSCKGHCCRLPNQTCVRRIWAFKSYYIPEKLLVSNLTAINEILRRKLSGERNRKAYINPIPKKRRKLKAITKHSAY